MILNTLMKVVQLWKIFTFSLTLPAAEGEANKNPQHLQLSLASQFLLANTSHHSFALLSITPAYIVVTSPVPARLPGSKPSRMTLFFYLSLVPCDSLEGVTLYWSIINIAQSLSICTTQIKSYIFLCVAGRFSPWNLPAYHSCNRAGYKIISEIVSHGFFAQSCNSCSI